MSTEQAKEGIPSKAIILKSIVKLLLELKEAQEKETGTLETKLATKLEEARSFRENYDNARNALYKEGVPGKNKEERDAYLTDKLLDQRILCHTAEDDREKVRAEVLFKEVKLRSMIVRLETMRDLLLYLT